jgi:hypothetical protein
LLTTKGWLAAKRCSSLSSSSPPFYGVLYYADEGKKCRRQLLKSISKVEIEANTKPRDRSGSGLSGDGYEQIKRMVAFGFAAVLQPTAIGFGSRVARFILVQTYQNGENVPNDNKLYQTAIFFTK